MLLCVSYIPQNLGPSTSRESMIANNSVVWSKTQLGG